MSRDNLVPLDFEYHTSSEEKMHLVCCSLMYKGKIYEHWLHDKTDVEKLNRNLARIKKEGKILVCFNAVAEGSAIYSLGLNPLDFKWIDIQAEYKMLLNHWEKFKYGKQYIDGKYKVTTPPTKHKYKMNEQERLTHDFSLPKSNLLACTYKILDIEVDSEHKDKMRDLILTKDYQLIQDSKEAINEYCSSDITELLEIWDGIKTAYYEYFEAPERGIQGEITMDEVLYRGSTVVRSALMQRAGYPINERKLRNLVRNSPIIMRELMEDINSQFDWDLFSPNNSDAGYKQNQKEWKEFISNSEHKDWIVTKTGSISLKLEAFTNKFSYRHDYPRGNFYAQAIRFLNTRQALNGLAPSKDAIKKKDTIFDNLGSDGRVRYYPNSYGGQSARYQPPQKSFIFLKPSWMRGIVEAPKGRAICAIDYKSEEALIGALNSGDKGMLEAYASGDVYLDYAKRAKGVPETATKKTHKKERDLFKSTYLGISYLMGAKALAKKLTVDTGIKYTEADAKDLIDKFYQVAYPTYKQYLSDVVFTYSELGFLKLSDGWVMFGDNPNFRSVSNLPIQGEGSCILRKAIQLAQEAGLLVIFGLHDAVYIEYDFDDLSAIDTLQECMRVAFAWYFEGELKTKALELIQFDIDIWGPDYTDGESITPQGNICKRQTIYIDPRSASEYEKFKKYMD